MKKFFEKYSYIGCLLPFIIGGLFPIVMMFIGIWKACNGNIGYFILNILAIPFTIIGAINIFRGFCSVLEEDGEKFDYNKNWKLAIYLLITIGGYIALFLAIAQLIKWNR